MTYTAEKAMVVIFAFLPALLLLFIVTACRQRLSALHKITAGLCIATALTYAPPWPLPFYEGLTIVWSVLTFLIICLALTIALRAWLKRVHETGAILLGVISLLAGILIEALEVTGMVHPDEILGESPSILAVPFMAICTLYALSGRFVRLAESERALSGRILTAHEEERKRLARDLHDGVGQTLLSIKLKLQMLEAKAKEGLAAGTEPLGKLIAGVSSAIEEIREVSMDLRPSVLEDMDIVDSLRWYSGRFSEKTGIGVTLDVGDNPPKIEPRAKDNLYRIFQEALGNASKHSGASEIAVILRREGRALTLSMKDNGAGFDPVRQSRQKKGIGLETMRERAELLGGAFALTSAPGEGTTVRVEMPLS